MFLATYNGRIRYLFEALRLLLQLRLLYQPSLLGLQPKLVRVAPPMTGVATCFARPSHLVAHSVDSDVCRLITRKRRSSQ